MKKLLFCSSFFLLFISSTLFGEIIYIEPYTINASKGDLLLSGSPVGFIGETLSAGFGGYWGHSGMMIDDGYQIRHNTLGVDKLRINSNWIGVPTGVNADDLEHGQPGLITERTQWVSSTDVVLKPLDIDEKFYRPFLEQIAEKNKWLVSYYRIHSYINSSVDDWLNQFNNSNTLTPHTGAHCSGQLWYANYLMGKEMNVFYAPPSMVDAGAHALHNGLYQLILEEVKSKGGFWGNLFNTLTFINYEDIADKIANQVVNAFGLDVYNDTNPTWKKYLGKTHTYAVAPDHLIMTSMANPPGKKTGIQTANSSFYQKIESTVKGGGYYIDTETGNKASVIVIIYQDQQFSGNSKSYYGPQSYPTMPWNDAVSSIKVKPGYKVTLYEHPNFQGHSWSYYCDNRQVPWNDTASSMIIEKSPPPVACIFKDNNYSEIPVCFFGEVSDSKLSNDIGDNTVSSILILNTKYKVVLYEHENFGGSAINCVIKTPVLNNFDDSASSVKVLLNRSTNTSVSFQSAHGKYLVAENGGGNTINANRTAIVQWEKFVIESPESASDGDTIFIRTVNNFYVSADVNGNLDGNRNGAGPWETFTLIIHSNPGGSLRNNDVISLKSAHNTFVVAELDGSAKANKANIGPWEKFKVILH